MKKLSLALCIAAIVTTTTSYANGYPMPDKKSHVEIDKKIEVDIDANYEIHSRVTTNGVGAAVIENDQRVIGNGQRRVPVGVSSRGGPGGHGATNYYHENKSTISKNSFKDASGNVGVNMADGDHNVQANNVAAAAVAERAHHDKTFAFSSDRGGYGGYGGYSGAGDAEIFSNQESHYNRVTNHASTNRSVIDSAFENASGNIGVNVTTGNNNIQANNLALSTYTGYVGVATVVNVQESEGNTTSNMGTIKYTKHSYAEMDDSAMQGTASYKPTMVVHKTSNESHIDNAFRGANGNIGVNISAGTGNLQSNSLALVSLTK